MIKVSIADDHKIFRQGLLSLIKEVGNIEIVSEADNGEQALDNNIRLQPDVALLDISMGGRDGIDVASEMIRRKLPTKIVMLTMHADVTVANRALKIGVHGYLLKDDAFEQLIDTIKMVHAGRTYISPVIAGELFKLRESKVKVVISNREQQVVKLIAEGLSSKEIADRLFIGLKTVETHRRRVMQKLNVHKATDLVKYAIKHGLVVDLKS